MKQHLDVVLILSVFLPFGNGFGGRLDGSTRGSGGNYGGGFGGFGGGPPGSNGAVGAGYGGPAGGFGGGPYGLPGQGSGLGPSTTGGGLGGVGYPGGAPGTGIGVFPGGRQGLGSGMSTSTVSSAGPGGGLPTSGPSAGAPITGFGLPGGNVAGGAGVNHNLRVGGPGGVSPPFVGSATRPGMGLPGTGFGGAGGGGGATLPGGPFSGRQPAYPGTFGATAGSTGRIGDAMSPIGPTVGGPTMGLSPAAVPGGNSNYDGGYHRGGVSPLAGAGSPVGIGSPTTGFGVGLHGGPVTGGSGGAAGGLGGVASPVSTTGGGSGSGSAASGVPNVGGSSGPLSGSGLNSSPAAGAGAAGPSGPSPSLQKKDHKCTSVATKVAVGVVTTAAVAGVVGVGVHVALHTTKKQRKRRLNAVLKRVAGVREQLRLAAAGRKRRSILQSKVPEEILDHIPMNFERLY